MKISFLLPCRNWEISSCRVTLKRRPIRVRQIDRISRNASERFAHDRSHSLIRFVIGLAMLVAGGLESSFARDFRVNQMPNGNRFGCANCHLSASGGDARNAFGRAVEAIVKPGLPTPFWSPALAAKDSDGDGFTNGQELGDPSGTFQPIAGAQITNPGVASSKPVNKAPTIQITSPASGTTITPPANLEVQASAADSDGTVAKVEFFANGTLALTVTSAPYVYSAPAASFNPGTYSITAKATDNAGASATSAAIQVTIAAPANVPPTVAITSPASGTVIAQPATIEVTATASDSDGSIAKVEFLTGRTLLSTVTSAPYVLTIASTDLGVGSHTITAKATDNSGEATTSEAIEITVTAPPNQPPLIQITQPVGGAIFQTTDTLNVLVSTSDPDGTVAMVEFFAGTNLVFSSTNAPFAYSVAAASFAPGAYSITAKATDNLGAIGTSAAVQITVAESQQQTPVTISSVTKTDQGIRLVWTGGKGPFVLQQKLSLSDTVWTPGITVTNSEVTIPMTSAAGFFRVTDMEGTSP